MSILTEEEKELLVIERIGAIHLAGNAMSTQDCFCVALEAAEKALMAKLATMELPKPCGGDFLAEGHYYYTAAQLHQAYAQGAASQLSAEPVAWYDEEMDSAYTKAELDGGTEEGLRQLYTLKTKQ